MSCIYRCSFYYLSSSLCLKSFRTLRRSSQNTKKNVTEETDLAFHQSIHSPPNKDTLEIPNTIPGTSHLPPTKKRIHGLKGASDKLVDYYNVLWSARWQNECREQWKNRRKCPNHPWRSPVESRGFLEAMTSELNLCSVMDYASEWREALLVGKGLLLSSES